MPASIRLRAVTFDRKDSGRDLALPVVASAGAAAATVDWSRSSTGVAATPVAYAMGTAGPLTVTVELKITAALGPDVRVRTRDLSNSPVGGLRAVRLSNPAPGIRTQVFRLDAPQFDPHGVDQVSADWQWEFRTGTVWVPFDSPFGRSTHVVFIILGEPEAPWGRPGTSGTAAPWLDVMTHSCGWAKGEMDAEGCEKAITRHVHGLGGQKNVHVDADGTSREEAIRYLGTASFKRSLGRFWLSGFFDMVNLRSVLATLNCFDCAGAVALLSSALGCPLRVARIDPSPTDPELHTNPVQLLGPPTTIVRAEDFNHHYVTSTVATSASGPEVGDHVWDACLKLDTDAAADSTPFTPGLA